MAAADLTKPSGPGIYEYFLGGCDYVDADKALGAELEAACPGLPEAVRASRRFILAAAGWAVSMLGVCRIIDVGCGRPSGRSVHEEARARQDGQGVSVAYVDRDAVTVGHCRAVYAGAAGVTVSRADAGDPQAVLAAAGAGTGLACVLLGGTLSAMDAGQAREAAAGYAAALEPGSAVAISVVSYRDQALGERQAALFGTAGTAGQWRNHDAETVQSFFDAAGLRVMRGQVADVARWPLLFSERKEVAAIGGMGIKD